MPLLKVSSLRLPDHVHTNHAFICSGGGAVGANYCQIKSEMSPEPIWFKISRDPIYGEDELGLNFTMRTDHHLSMTPKTVSFRDPDIGANGLHGPISCIVKYNNLPGVGGSMRADPLPSAEFISAVMSQFKEIPIYNGIRYGFKFDMREFLLVFVALPRMPAFRWGFLCEESEICLAPADSAVKFIGGGGGGGAAGGMFKKKPNFKEMGIGGLDAEFETIFRRAFMSRVIPKNVREALGIGHVKGILLHGPPGTGKTLIARKLGELLDCIQSEPVQGPSLLNKYVGESEANVRRLFEPAMKDTDENNLYLIIIDEADAICKKRGARGDSTGVGDNVVNQLLSMIDGPKSLNNVLLIFTTNRIDLIDEAILRPGRMEVQIETHLPDEKGRSDILEIHTRTMRSHDYLDDSVDLHEIALICKNYTGAELESVIKSAASIALARQVDPGKLDETLKKFTAPKITQRDFLDALKDIVPAFGAVSDIITVVTSTPFLLWSSDITEMHRDFSMLLKSLRAGCNMNILVTGRERTGKTKLVCDVAKKSGIECIKFVCSEDLIITPDRAIAIYEIFKRASATEESIVILDGLEYLIEYSPLGNIYTNKVLQVIFACLNMVVTSGNKLTTVITSSNPSLMDMLGIVKLMNKTYHIDGVLTSAHTDLFKLMGFDVGECDVLVSNVFDRLKTR